MTFPIPPVDFLGWLGLTRGKYLQCFRVPSTCLFTWLCNAWPGNRLIDWLIDLLLLCTAAGILLEPGLEKAFLQLRVYASVHALTNCM